jgi:hypothetical protein
MKLVHTESFTIKTLLVVLQPIIMLVGILAWLYWITPVKIKTPAD